MAQTATPKVPECPGYGNFCKVTQSPHFLKKCKGATKNKFSKIAKKSSPRLKDANGIIALWRKWHYSLISMLLKCKDWRRFWRNLYALIVQRLEKTLAQTAATKMPEWPSYGNFCKVTQSPHFLEKCKGRTKNKFSKIAQKRNPRLEGLKALWRKWHYLLRTALL